LELHKARAWKVKVAIVASGSVKVYPTLAVVYKFISTGKLVTVADPHSVLSSALMADAQLLGDALSESEVKLDLSKVAARSYPSILLTKPFFPNGS
jgi:precorrin-3B methylase